MYTALFWLMQFPGLGCKYHPHNKLEASELPQSNLAYAGINPVRNCHLFGVHFSGMLAVY